jgi:predicted alpha/beta-fold hydrolase
MLSGLYGGHGQTFLIGLREKLYPAMTSKTRLEYTKRELFKYSDGGQTILAFLGDCFSEAEVDPKTFINRPILLIIPGLTSTSYECYIQNLVMDAHKREFDVIVINHRGLAGCELSSPKLYSGESTIDFREPMNYIH